MQKLGKEYNLFLANSPFQLICAIEAAKHFDCKKNILVIRLSRNQRNNEQIELLLKRYDIWDNIYKISFRLHEFISFLTYLILINKVKRSIQINNLFIGEFRAFEMHLFYNNIKTDNVCLIDDGTIMLKVQKELIANINNYYFESKWKFVLKKRFVRIFGLKWNNIEIPNLFTFFKLQPVNNNQLILKNDFNFIKSKINSDSNTTNAVYFIGSPSVEDGIISSETFFDLLNRINKFYLEKRMEIKYISHRRENSNKLKKIEKMLKSSILSFNKPLELELMESKELPKVCSSFFSTALFTIHSIFKNIETTSFIIPIKEVAIKDKSRISLFYENMKENNIKIIEDF